MSTNLTEVPVVIRTRLIILKIIREVVWTVRDKFVAIHPLKGADWDDVKVKG